MDKLSEYRYQLHLAQTSRHPGIDFSQDPREYGLMKEEFVEKYPSRILTGRGTFMIKLANDETRYVAGNPNDDIATYIEEHLLEKINGQLYTVTFLPNMLEYAYDFICIVDFCGQSGGFSISYSSDWSVSRKEVVFSGLWSDVPNMPSEKLPTEEDVEDWVEKHPSVQYEDAIMKKDHRRTLDFLQRVKSFIPHS
jgi:hypothetical protein